MAIPLALVIGAVGFLLFAYFSRSTPYFDGANSGAIGQWGRTYQAAWTPPTPWEPPVSSRNGQLVFRDRRRAEILNSSGAEQEPHLSPDGAYILFSSNRGGAMDGFDLFWSRVEGNGFSPPQALSMPLNSEFNERSPSVAYLGDGEYLLLFSSNRFSGSPVDHDLYVARGRFG
ncbi:MAG: hypothetical protein GY953_26810, partial [bacterium]|nr:hypothetical protein [bacterium]